MKGTFYKCTFNFPHILTLKLECEDFLKSFKKCFLKKEFLKQYFVGLLFGTLLIKKSIFL